LHLSGIKQKTIKIMKALWLIFGFVFLGTFANAQYDRYDTYGYEDSPQERYYYQDDFDWRWDVRVRISDGINSGLLTRREANRLYDQLERIERKEYAYQADGYYSAYEQDEIWNEVTWLNRKLGLELYDRDRTYYGFSVRGLAFNGYLPWYFGNRYDFNRFDRRGYGSIRLGYGHRNYYSTNHYYARVWNNNRPNNAYNRTYSSRPSYNNNRLDNRNNYERSRNTGTPRGIEPSRGQSAGKGDANSNNRSYGNSRSESSNGRTYGNSNPSSSSRGDQRSSEYGNSSSSRSEQRGSATSRPSTEARGDSRNSRSSASTSERSSSRSESGARSDRGSSSDRGSRTRGN
jgi:hypothetical protein